MKTPEDVKGGGRGPQFLPGLTPDQVDEIRRLSRGGETYPTLSEKFGVAGSVICNAARGKRQYEGVGTEPPLDKRKPMPRKLTEDQMAEVRRLADQGLSRRAIGRRMAVHHGTITEVLGWKREPHCGQRKEDV